MYMIGRVVAFKGEEEEALIEDEGASVELTEATREGTLELAFDLPGKLRVVFIELPDKEG